MPFEAPPWLAMQPYQRNSRIPELLIASGRAQSDNALRQGAIWGNAARELGGIGAGGVVAHQEQKKAEKAAQMEKVTDAAFMDLLQKTEGNPSPMSVLRLYGPERGLKISQGLQAFAAMSERKGEQALAFLPKLINGLDAVSESVRAQLYPAARAKALETGLFPPESIPEQYHPDTWAEISKLGKGLNPEKDDAYTLNPGDKRFKGEKMIAENPAKAPAGPATGSFEDFVVRKYGVQPTPEQITAARKEYQQADDRPYRDPVPVVILTDKGPQLLDRKTNTATPINQGGGGGGKVAPPKTTEERNKAAGKDRAQPVLDSITELSEKINTQQGLYAKMAGGAAKIAAKANLDDDVSEYQALVASFTPMVARLLGHTGVLTQQDVDSARAILPAPTDSKSLRDRKIARIKSLLGSESSAGSPGKVGRFTVEVEK